MKLFFEYSKGSGVAKASYTESYKPFLRSARKGLALH